MYGSVRGVYVCAVGDTLLKGDEKVANKMLNLSHRGRLKVYTRPMLQSPVFLDLCMG